MTLITIPAPFRVLIAGCSYAGLSAAINLLDLSKGLSPRLSQTQYTHHTKLRRIPLEITIVDERDGFFHLIGSPLALASASYAPKAWVRFGDITALQRPDVRFIHGSITSVNCGKTTASITEAKSGTLQTVPYDYFIAASGLRRASPVAPQSATRQAYLDEASEQIRNNKDAKFGVVVVGGGAVGIEMAAELKLVFPDLSVTLVHSRDKLMSSEGLPDEVKDRALELLTEAGVEVKLSHRVVDTQREDDGSSPRYNVSFGNGHKMVASQVVWALSRSVSTGTYLPTSAVDEEGYVKVLPNLRFDSDTPNAASHFAAGDLARWSGIKRCGAAMHMGHYVAVNMHQTILHRLDSTHVPKFLELSPVAPMIGLAVGRKAVAYGPDSGMSSGEDVMKAYFGDDLGFNICWNYMKLGERSTAD